MQINCNLVFLWKISHFSMAHRHRYLFFKFNDIILDFSPFFLFCSYFFSNIACFMAVFFPTRWLAFILSVCVHYSFLFPSVFFLCSYHFCSLNWWCFIRLLFRTMEILLHSRIHCSHIKKETFNARSHIYEKCQSNG